MWEADDIVVIWEPDGRFWIERGLVVSGPQILSSF
jgi:hypothetical protein